MLPRFDSQVTEQSDRKRIRLLPRFQINEERLNFSGKFLDRPDKKCWPMINTKIAKFDIQYAYEVVGDVLESYVHYRKLDRCKALSNFIEYRNKVYKREKIGQMHPESTINIPTKTIQIEQETPSLSSSISPISVIDPSTPSPSLQSMSPKTSQNLSPSTPHSPSQSINSKPSTPSPSIQSMSSKTSQKLLPPKPIPPSRSMSPNTSQKASPASIKESIIPIPSPGLLKKPVSKQSKINTPKKPSSTIKQTSSSSPLKRRS